MLALCGIALIYDRISVASVREHGSRIKGAKEVIGMKIMDAYRRETTKQGRCIPLRLEFLKQEVSVGVKTKTSVEAQDKLPEKARNVSKKTASGKSIPTWEDRKGNN
ncbi:hypothetical protein Tco_1265046 [Tanacetum coccineum]